MSTRPKIELDKTCIRIFTRNGAADIGTVEPPPHQYSVRFPTGEVIGVVDSIEDALPLPLEGCLHAACRSACAAADLSKQVTVHTLRHTFATHLLESGADVRIIQALRGHASLASTARYTRVATKTISNTPSPLDRLPGSRAARLSGCHGALEVADMFRRHGEAFRQARAGRLGHIERHIIGAITACRTAVLGGHVEECD